MIMTSAVLVLLRWTTNVHNGTHVIDVDEIDPTHFHITFDDRSLRCIPKTPPLSHSWSYECQED